MNRRIVWCVLRTRVVRRRRVVVRFVLLLLFIMLWLFMILEVIVYSGGGGGGCRRKSPMDGLCVDECSGWISSFREGRSSSLRRNVTQRNTT